ncbi:hypothetical protein Tco_0488753 [Tanacetum coccineum]
MEPDINNMALNEYLMYEDRNRNSARSYPSRESVASVRNRIWVYPDSDEEDEEYYSFALCFQTPQPCATINSVHHNNHNEVDIKNMTIEEYARFELTMATMISEIQVPTHGFTSYFFNQPQHIPNPPLDKEDSSFDKILDDLFRIGPDNIRKYGNRISPSQNQHGQRCDDEMVDIIDYEDSDHKDSELPDLPTFFATDKFASVYKQVEENISIAEEKKEAPMEDVEIDEDQDIDHSYSGSHCKGMKFEAVLARMPSEVYVLVCGGFSHKENVGSGHSVVPTVLVRPFARIRLLEFRVTECFFRPHIIIHSFYISSTVLGTLSEKRFASSGHLWELMKDEICISSGMLGIALDSLTHLFLKWGRVSFAF